MPRTIVVQIEATATPGPQPNVTGRTNLPDGTRISISMRPPFPACTPRCGHATIDTEVKDGQFRVGPFTSRNSRQPYIGGDLNLDQGIYNITVTTTWDQPERVAAVIGKDGERLEGRFVKTMVPASLSDSGHAVKMVWCEIPVMAGGR